MDSLDLDYELSMEAPFRSRSNTWPLPRPDDSLELLCGQPLEPCAEVLGSCSSFGTLVGDGGDSEELRPPEAGSLTALHSHLHSLHSLHQHPQQHGQPLAGGGGGQQLCAENGGSPRLSGSGERLDEVDELGQLEQLGAGAPGAAVGPHGEQLSPQSALKKNSSRRNAWGNMSYADLITQAIQQSVEQRLTLSQIYEWMVHNVSYFKDKGDSNSSAGWKVSAKF